MMVDLVAAGLNRVHERIAGRFARCPGSAGCWSPWSRATHPVLGASGPGPGGADASTGPVCVTTGDAAAHSPEPAAALCQGAWRSGVTCGRLRPSWWSVARWRGLVLSR